MLASTAKPVPKSFRRPHKDFPTAERVKAGFMRARRYSRVIVALALAVGLVLGVGVRGRVAFRGRRDSDFPTRAGRPRGRADVAARFFKCH